MVTPAQFDPHRRPLIAGRGPNLAPASKDQGSIPPQSNVQDFTASIAAGGDQLIGYEAKGVRGGHLLASRVQEKAVVCVLAAH